MKQPAKIMVIEDENLLLQAISSKLKQKKMDVVSCTSARQALDYLESFPEMPDLIWLDYYLTDMNGLQFFVQIKSHPEWSKIPVIVVSNSASTDKVDQMLALGAKKYVLKASMRLEELAAVVNELVEENKA